MRTLIFILLFASQAHAITLEIIGKNGQLLFKHEQLIQLPSQLGEVSLSIFKQHQLSFKGGAYGFTSIFDLDQNLEIISDIEMKAHGWCFSVNGLTPETMADETSIPDQTTIIRWYYAYAHYKSDQWIGQCVKN